MKIYIPIVAFASFTLAACNKTDKNEAAADGIEQVEADSVAGVWKTAFRERMEFTPDGEVYICRINDNGEEKIQLRGRYRVNGSVLAIKLDRINSVDTEPGPWEKHHFRITEHPVVAKVLEFYDPDRPNRATVQSEFVRESSR